MIQFDHSGAEPFLDEEAWERLLPRVLAAHHALLEGSGAGSEWLGWRSMLSTPNDALLENIEQTAAEIRRHADVLVCIGIGGSYLGARAVIKATAPYFSSAPVDDTAPRQPEIIFAGHHLSGAYLKDLFSYLDGKSVYVNVISKSGSTLEPSIAFRFLRQLMESRYENASVRIIVTTDAHRGALYEFSKAKGYRTYAIPSDIGGRYSVLTPVGLLPIAAAGVDIRALFYGAVAMQNDLLSPDGNLALSYAGIRHSLLTQGYSVEVLALFEPRLSSLGAWWQQLFGESEGKNNTGVFPTVAHYTTDLHSLGQYMQDGRRDLFETFVLIDDDAGVTISPDAGDLDDLNYLSGKTIDSINRSAYEGTSRAHGVGGVPIMTIRLDSLSAENLGRCIYFFQHAAAIGGYLLGVNPFDQPGVEAYKSEMLTSLRSL